ncbi:hypothetical protein E2320_004473 [Naja naja]|nr:hypothetical protein E2320_004473 [Naja naja]
MDRPPDSRDVPEGHDTHLAPPLPQNLQQRPGGQNRPHRQSFLPPFYASAGELNGHKGERERSANAEGAAVLLAGSFSSLPQVPQERLLKLSLSGQKKLGWRVGQLRKRPPLMADTTLNGAWFSVNGTMAARRQWWLQNCLIDCKPSKRVQPQQVFRGGKEGKEEPLRLEPLCVGPGERKIRLGLVSSASKPRPSLQGEAPRSSFPAGGRLRQALPSHGCIYCRRRSYRLLDLAVVPGSRQAYFIPSTGPPSDRRPKKLPPAGLWPDIRGEEPFWAHVPPSSWFQRESACTDTCGPSRGEGKQPCEVDLDGEAAFNPHPRAIPGLHAAPPRRFGPHPVSCPNRVEGHLLWPLAPGFPSVSDREPPSLFGEAQGRAVLCLEMFLAFPHQATSLLKWGFLRVNFFQPGLRCALGGWPCPLLSHGGCPLRFPIGFPCHSQGVGPALPPPVPAPDPHPIPALK